MGGADRGLCARHQLPQHGLVRGLDLGEYWAYKSRDTILDIALGNLAFNLPLWVLACGIYAGNIMR